LTLPVGRFSIFIGIDLDEKKFLDLLKNLQSIMRCPSCGEVYEVSEMQFVGSQEGYFLLSMTCTKCTLPVWVNFFAGQKHSGMGGQRDVTVRDLDLLSAPPIESAEIIDFHLFLKVFDGNFKKVFRRKMW